MKKPKFKLGSRLWPVVRVKTLWSVFPPFDLQFFIPERNILLYGFTRDFGYMDCDVFDNKADAQAECDRRNVGIEKRVHPAVASLWDRFVTNA